MSPIKKRTEIKSTKVLSANIDKKYLLKVLIVLRTSTSQKDLEYKYYVPHIKYISTMY